MKRALTNLWALGALAAAILVVSAALAAWTGEAHWFQRSGSLVVVVGVFIAARRVVRMGYRRWRDGLRVVDNGHFVPGPEEAEEDRQSDLDATAQVVVGPVVAFVGTIVWGYGDLLWRLVVG